MLGFILMILLIAIVVILIFSTVKIVPQSYAYVVERIGAYDRTLNVGLHILIPLIDRVSNRVSLKEQVMDFAPQPVITKDNVSVRINAVIYYKIFDASKAILEVENFYYAVSQLAQTTMRNVVGSVSLNELLGEREKISVEICKIIDEATDPWGIKVENVELKDVSLPEEMKRVIARAAEAEREKEAILTKAKGEVEASKNLAIAAETMSSTPGAMHLRTLSTINDISSDQSNTIIFCLPIEVLEAIKGKSINEDVIKKITKKDN